MIYIKVTSVIVHQNTLMNKYTYIRLRFDKLTETRKVPVKLKKGSKKNVYLYMLLYQNCL